MFELIFEDDLICPGWIAKVKENLPYWLQEQRPYEAVTHLQFKSNLHQNRRRTRALYFAAFFILFMEGAGKTIFSYEIFSYLQCPTYQVIKKEQFSLCRQKLSWGKNNGFHMKKQDLQITESETRPVF